MYTQSIMHLVDVTFLSKSTSTVHVHFLNLLFLRNMSSCEWVKRCVLHSAQSNYVFGCKQDMWQRTWNVCTCMHLFHSHNAVGLCTHAIVCIYTQHSLLLSTVTSSPFISASSPTWHIVIVLQYITAHWRIINPLNPCTIAACFPNQVLMEVSLAWLNYMAIADLCTFFNVLYLSYPFSFGVSAYTYFMYCMYEYA